VPQVFIDSCKSNALSGSGESDRQFCGFDKTAKQGLLSLEFRDGLACCRFQFSQLFRGVVRQGVAFQVAPPVLIWVELWCVRWEEIGSQSLVTSQEFLNLLAAVRVQSVPDQKYRSPQMAEQIPQEGNDLFLANRTISVEMEIPSEPVTLRGNRQRADQRQMPMMPGTGLQHGCLTTGCPRAMNERHQKHAGFIDKYDRTTTAGSLFLKRGQACAIQLRMAGSLRSRAWRSGFCTEKPNDFMSRGMWST
jgi:hypothetical protein